MLTVKSEVIGRPSVVSDILLKVMKGFVKGGGRFTISGLSYEFVQMLFTVLYDIFIVRLGFLMF
jgi:hypothetical protein